MRTRILLLPVLMIVFLSASLNTGGLYVQEFTMQDELSARMNIPVEVYRSMDTNDYFVQAKNSLGSIYIPSIKDINSVNDIRLFFDSNIKLVIDIGSGQKASVRIKDIIKRPIVQRCADNSVPCSLWYDFNTLISYDDGLLLLNLPGGIYRIKASEKKLLRSTNSINKKYPAARADNIEVTPSGTIIRNNNVQSRIELLRQVSIPQEKLSFVLIGNNFVSIDSIRAPEINIPAKIYFPLISYDFKPVIIRDNTICTDCEVLSYDKGVIFSVPHFTNYSTSANSELTIYDSGDETSSPIYYYQYVTFTANYTNITSKSPINSINTFCELSVQGHTKVNMSFTGSLYTQKLFFNTTGLKKYNITCDGTDIGYEAINLSDSVVISNRSYRWYGGSVQRGTITGTASVITADINAVDINRSFILFTARSNDVTPDDWSFTANFTNSTRIAFTRYGTATSTISYEVITSDGIISQHGYAALGVNEAQVNVTINPVNPQTSFIVVSGRCADESNSDNPARFFKANFTNETQITLRRGNANLCAGTVNWQVVDWAGTKVQHKSTVIPDLQDSASPVINTVNWTESFLLFGQENSGSDPGMDSNWVKGNHTASNTLFFTDEPGTTYASSRKDIDYFVVTIPNSSVQLLETSLSSDTSVDINKVNLSRSFILASGWNTGGGQTYTNSFYNINFTNSTRLFFDKQTGAQTQHISTYVVEFPVADPVPSFTSLVEDPVNNSVYAQVTYTFNATVTNTNGTVGLTFNGVNYTPTNTGAEYSVTLSTLAAGNHYYYWWAYGQGINKPYNSTETILYTVRKANSTVLTYVNNTRNNISIERLSSIYLNGTKAAGEGIIKLYNNGSLINSGQGPLSNLTAFNNVGLYNISTVYDSTQNYSYSIETWFVNVSDTIKPNITDVKNVSITDVSAIIQWLTDEPANSSVSWGNTTSLLNKTTDSTLRTTHSILLSNLNPLTQYFYNVTSCDPYGNCRSEGMYNFTTLSEPDTTPPQITNESADGITQNTANITWLTDEPANSSVEYGTTKSLGSKKVDSVYLSSHNIQLTGLSALTLYYYNVTSCDASGNCNTTGPYNFTTSDTTPPTWSNNKTSPPSGVTYSKNADYQFNITWNDNIAVHTVMIEHNFTGTPDNYTVLQNGNEYYYNYSDIPAGTYYWRMYANDTSSNNNSTPAFTYEIKKIPGSTNLTLNGSASNITIQKKDNVTITGFTIVPQGGNITILRNGQIIASSLDNITINETFNLVGSYNITARFPGSENHSSAETTLFVFVTNSPPSHSTNVKAENNILVMDAGTTEVNLTLSNNYNLTKTFLRLNFASGSPNNALPDQTSVSAYFINSTTLRLQRYATGSDPAYVSYSILEANNIISIPFNKSWAGAEESSTIKLQKSLVDDYSTKCFIESHRNMRLNSSDLNSHAEYEVRASIRNQTHIDLIRDTEGVNVADEGVQYGFVVCFLDETVVQTNVFSIAGDVGSKQDININAVQKNESWSTISYYQADDGVGQNSLLANLTTSSNLRIQRDEIGGSQTAFGRYYLVDFEDKAGAFVQHISYTAPGTGSLLNYTTQNFTPVNRSSTLLNCENTMGNGGGTAHSRGEFVFKLNSSNDAVFMQEGRDRNNNQFASVMCQIIQWPGLTTYQDPSDLIITNITFDDQFYQGVNGQINVSITNKGLRDAENITINLTISDWNGTTYVYNTTLQENYELLVSNKTVNITFLWNASRGNKTFFAFVDSTYQNDEQNENNNNYTVIKNITAPTISLVYAYVNNTRNNITILQYSAIWLNATLIVGEGNVSILINGTTIANGTSPQSTYYNFTNPGLYNITAYYKGNINYTNASESFFVTVNAGSPPTPQNIIVEANDHDATISWTTARKANSTVFFGLTTSLDNKTANDTYVYDHSIILSLLEANTKYYYKVQSCNIFGCANSTTDTFTTLIDSSTCVIKYLEKGPYYKQGYISKGDVVSIECPLAGGVGKNEDIVNIITWTDTSTQKTVSTPRILYNRESLYP